MLVSSSHRPIPLIRRSDLQVSVMSCRGDEHVLVKDPLSLNYFRLPVLQYRVLSAMDGQRSLEEILSLVRAGGNSSTIEAHEVFRLILDLAGKHLIFSRRPGTIDGLLAQRSRDSWQRFWKLISNPLFIQLPGLYPRDYLSQAAQRYGWFYSLPVVLLVMAFVLFSWTCCLLRADQFARELTSTANLLSGQAIWTLWLVVGLLKVCHELSHGIACERLGAQCQSIGFAFLLFSPCMYCDVSDAWLLEKKRDRIAISLAGIYVELLISAMGFWIWSATAPGWLHQISLQVFLAGSIATLVFNANPLLKFDGYYVLADLVEIPNLYARSRQAVRRLAARCCLGIPTPQDSPLAEERCQTILLSYGLASLGYQVPVLLGLWMFLVYFFNNLGLPAIPLIALSVSAVAGAFRAFGWISQLSQQPSSAKPRRLNVSLTTLGLIGSLIGIWHLPIQSSVTAPAMIEPGASAPVYVETPGTVRQVCVKEGDLVEAGALLVHLEDLALDRRLIQLEGLEASHDIDFRMAQSIGDPDLMNLARTAQESVTEQLKHARMEKERLQLRAAVNGTVMSVEDSFTPENAEERKLGSRSLLNVDRVGSYLDRRTCVCQVVAESEWQAKIWTRQQEHPYLTKGQAVAIRLDAFPGGTLQGRIVSISAADETQVPASLSARSGGPIPTRSNGHVEVPAEPMYSAMIALKGVNIPVQPGMRGTGQFSRPAMTVGSWLIDEFHHAFAAR